VLGTAYRIVSALDHKLVLTLRQGKAHTIVLDTFQSHDAQKFFFVSDHGKYTITCAAESRGPHVDEDSNQNGADIHAAHKGHKSNHFEIIPVTTGPQAGQGVNFRTFFGKSIDVYEGKAASGTRVVQWDYHGGVNQVWIITPFDLQ